ncbi:MAG: 2'-5' RNA ligase family protein [Actinobacteria bacterium]|nr:2'-5' RNA ligase family protein [Actinomycetota bacterium]
MAWDEPGSTALIVPVPAAEAVIGDLNRRYTPSGEEGVPAHVTLIVPFTHAREFTADREADVGAVLRRFRSFPFTLVRLRRFEDAGVLYLAPEPAEPFVEMIQALVAAFPEHPPYEGQHATIVPHVTIAELAEPNVMSQVRVGMRDALPIEAIADRVLLIERTEEVRWEVRRTFELEPVPSDPRSTLLSPAEDLPHA